MFEKLSRSCTLAVLTRYSINPHMTTVEHRHVGKQCIVISVGIELRWDRASGLNDVIPRLPSIINSCHELVFSQLEKSV